MKLPQIFRATGDCGCSPSSLSSGSPCSTSNQWCDERFGNLSATTRLQLFGTASGSICVGKFTPKRGFVFDDGSGAGQFISDEPIVSLTRVNPLSSGSFPATGTWPVMLAAVGADPMNWRFVQAPTAGVYRLETENGVFKFVDASTLPGLSNVCSGSGLVANVGVFGCFDTGTTDGSGNKIFVIKKLNTPARRVLIGHDDGAGNLSVKSLPNASPLEHPLGLIDAMQVGEFRETDPTSVADPKAPYANGIPELVAEGVAMTDCQLVVYSTGKHKFFRAPARLAEHISQNSIPGVSVGLTSGYVNVPGHLQFGSLAFNYPNNFVSFNVQTNTAERVTFGLFLDGVLVKEWTYTNASGSGYSSPTLHHGSCVLKNVVTGNHTLEIKVKGTTGSSVFEYTDASVFSLP